MQLRQIEASLVIISSVYFAGTSYVTNINVLRPHASDNEVIRSDLRPEVCRFERRCVLSTRSL